MFIIHSFPAFFSFDKLFFCFCFYFVSVLFSQVKQEKCFQIYMSNLGITCGLFLQVFPNFAWLSLDFHALKNHEITGFHQQKMYYCLCRVQDHEIPLSKLILYESVRTFVKYYIEMIVTGRSARLGYV